MKKSWMTVGLVALLVAVLLMGNLGGFSPEVMAETETVVSDMAVNVVSVSGVGSISVKPDIAYINVGVETQNADAGVAQKENATKMTAVMAALTKAGIKDEDIKTVQYSIYDRYDYLENGQDVKYYNVTNVVKVTVRDITKVGDVIDAASGAGSNQISSIQFGISNEDEVYQEALKAAMMSAKTKATSIMGTFGKTPGIPAKVTESSYYSGVVRMEYSAVAMDSKMSTPVSSGELTVSANVTVEYNY